MSILLLVVSLMVASRGLASLFPTREVFSDQVVLGVYSRIYTTNNVTSYTYEFPDAHLNVENGANLNAFGVKTNGSFSVSLYPAGTEEHSSPIVVEVEPNTCTVTYSEEDIDFTREFSCGIKMPEMRYEWFIIERTNSYLALYVSGESDPLVLISNYMMKTKLNFNKYRRYSFASDKPAYWDVHGSTFPSEVTSVPKSPFLEVSAKSILKAYKTIFHYFRRCDYATNAKPASEFEAYKMRAYVSLHCSNKPTKLWRAVLKRYAMILTTSGLALPPKLSDRQYRGAVLRRLTMK